MTEYRSNRVPGGTYFFTVNLEDRRSTLLVQRIDVLREAVRKVKGRGQAPEVVLDPGSARSWLPRGRTAGKRAFCGADEFAFTPRRERNA